MKLLTIFFLLATQVSISQILNVESLRKVTDTSGWSGAANLHFQLKRNTNDFINLGSDIHVQYKMNNHLVLFKNSVVFEKIEDENFDNNLVSHFRYNYRFHERIAWEAFAQGQYNKINLIVFRGLIGTGPRLKLTNSENYKFYLGTLLMYEYEEVDDGITPFQRDFRGSTYLSFSLYPSERISLVSTTYYQPKINSFSDYRISSESVFLVDLFKNFALQIKYIFTYDAFPAVGIPKSQYNFNTGFMYSFD
jgi:putative salt-induced outer membrane protein YdiY